MEGKRPVFLKAKMKYTKEVLNYSIEFVGICANNEEQLQEN